MKEGKGADRALAYGSGARRRPACLDVQVNEISRGQKAASQNIKHFTRPLSHWAENGIE